MMFDEPIVGKRRRGRQKTRWEDSCNRDTIRLGLKVKDERTIGREKSKTIPAILDDVKSLRTRK